ncbi:hypothetical protein BRADI_1g17762v3 [Brachypodium distachyon]|uniref:Uncharacterized protein n=1 Tax=Brachypodium distachyon TaxID=15368 RepID=A0A0Q3JRG6_BRADI|nr:hypothetical protein BRADI_1g17762v3 [Brachypodium distachyon]
MLGRRRISPRTRIRKVCKSRDFMSHLTCLPIAMFKRHLHEICHEVKPILENVCTAAVTPFFIAQSVNDLTIIRVQDHPTAAQIDRKLKPQFSRTHLCHI